MDYVLLASEPPMWVGSLTLAITFAGMLYGAGWLTRDEMLFHSARRCWRRHRSGRSRRAEQREFHQHLVTPRDVRRMAAAEQAALRRIRVVKGGAL